MFYNTGIATYIWLLSNRKPAQRQGYVQLIDAGQWFRPLRKNLGNKNCELAAADIERICDAFLAFEETPQSKIFPNAAFGYHKLAVERPLRLPGTDPARVYKAAELKQLRARVTPAPGAPPVIRKIHRPGLAPTPCAASSPPSSTANSASSNTSRTKICATPNKPPCSSRAASKAFCAAKSCPTRPTPGTTPPASKSATRSVSPATSTSPSPCAPRTKSGPTSACLSKKPKGCWRRSGAGPHEIRSKWAICVILCVVWCLV